MVFAMWAGTLHPCSTDVGMCLQICRTERNSSPNGQTDPSLGVQRRANLFVPRCRPSGCDNGRPMPIHRRSPGPLSGLCNDVGSGETVLVVSDLTAERCRGFSRPT